MKRVGNKKTMKEDYSKIASNDCGCSCSCCGMTNGEIIKLSGNKLGSKKK